MSRDIHTGKSVTCISIFKDLSVACVGPVDALGLEGDHFLQELLSERLIHKHTTHICYAYEFGWLLPYTTLCYE